jgi:cytochrome b pre-mRNA-processing protein 3
LQWRARGSPAVGDSGRSDHMGTMLFSVQRRRERDAADRLYRAVAEASRRPIFFTDFGVPDTLEGRLESLLLHVFPVVDRLRSGEEPDSDFSRLLAEAFVSDMDATLREMGVGDMSVPRRVKTLFGAFGGRLTAYAAAKDDCEALAAAIRRNVFADSGSADDASRLASYVQAAVAAIGDMPVAALKRGAPLFPEPQAYAGGCKP